MSDEQQNPAEELKAARARIARLEQEAETNRAFFARSLAQATEAPKRGGGWGVYGLVLLVGFGAGVLVSVGLMVARSEPTALMPAPPERKAAALPPPVVVAPIAAVVDAGAGAGAVAPVPAAVKAATLDDSGALNVTATAEAVVYVDGARVGPAPVHGHPVRPGAHVVRVACAAGPESERKVDVPPFAEVDVDHRCE